MMKLLSLLLVLFCATAGLALAQDAMSYYSDRQVSPARTPISSDSDADIASYGYTGNVVREGGAVGKTSVNKMSETGNRPVKSGSSSTSKVDVVDGAIHEEATGGTDQAETRHVHPSVNQATVALPPNMERGVRELEKSVTELPGYTSAMTKHIQQNGLRGFLAVTPELKEQGQSLGGRMGGGIHGIMTDVGKEMSTQAAPGH